MPALINLEELGDKLHVYIIYSYAIESFYHNLTGRQKKKELQKIVCNGKSIHLTDEK